MSLSPLLETRSDDPTGSARAAPRRAGRIRHVDVVIIGAGFAGLCMAIRLRQMGLSFVILERADDVGGTWRANTYPGCGCDIPSQLYSFSFELNSSWTRTYPYQPEILAYLRGCADKYQLRDAILLGTEAREAVLDEACKVWRVRTQQGDAFTAGAVVSAMGSLSRPAIPDIEGMERFKGKAFHSAQWDHSFDLAGKKVAVIGTGASAIQLIPQIATQVEKLCIFQRTPSWILPKIDFAHADLLQLMLRSIPGFKRLIRSLLYWIQEASGAGLVNPTFLPPLEWLSRWHLARKIGDPGLRNAVTPTYAMGCKRIVLSNDYYTTLCRENVELVTDAIAEIRDASILTQDQNERPFDAIIYATGFRVTDLLSPLRVVGRNGADLGALWRNGAEAFFGMTVAGFPNFFMLAGPNTLLAHNSVVFMIEAQVRYIVQGLQWLQERGSPMMDLRSDAQARFNRELGERAQGTVWASGCKSWYLDDGGRNVVLWPASPTIYWLRTRRFSPDDYSFSAS
jgi:cation diffusion facilitator CzcD-associated flavoprotein CzcO